MQIMFCLRSCLVGFFGFSIAVFRFHAPYAVGWDVHIKITHEHKGDTTYFSLTIGKDGQTSTVSFKASDKAPQMKNSGQKELFELDCGNGFRFSSRPLKTVLLLTLYRMLSKFTLYALMVSIMKKCSMLFPALNRKMCTL